MDISKFLGKVMGIYLIIVNLAMLVNMQQFASLISNLNNDAPLMFVSGFIALIVGLLAVVSHNVWQWSWRVIITILAWLILIKGITILFYPSVIRNLSLSFIQNQGFAYGTIIVDFVLGITLCYFGFKRG